MCLKNIHLLSFGNEEGITYFLLIFLACVEFHVKQKIRSSDQAGLSMPYIFKLAREDLECCDRFGGFDLLIV